MNDASITALQGTSRQALSGGVSRRISRVVISD
jgi:hypothetical protein